MVKTNDIVITMIGSGGDGVISSGEILLAAAAKEGLYGMLLKSFGPQIRGGESSAKLRISNDKLYTQGDLVNVLVVFNWADYPRFKTEYEVAEGAYIISDSKDKLNPLDQELPWKEKNLKNIQIPIAALTKEKTGGIRGKNIFALGLLAGMFDLPSDGLKEAIKAKFKKKSEAVVNANIASLEAGIAHISENKDLDAELKFEFTKGKKKIVIHGNDAMSMAAIHQGLDFYGSYPITPASEILMFLGTHLPKVGGTVIQAEDEISAINMAIGASFSGKKAMTGTSGAGVALKSEAIGLAGMAEIPLVIVNVMRGGPSTGLPTKFEQSDFLQAMYSTSGDSPKAVLAPTDVENVYDLGNVAFQIAEKYQMPVFVLSDQFLSARMESTDPFDLHKYEISQRLKPADNDENFLRYKLTENGVSPMPAVGQKGVIYQTSGLEHYENGRPTSDLDWHQKMSEKRQRKLDAIAKEFDEVKVSENENAKTGVIAWGSSAGAVKEAVQMLEKEGYNISLIVPQLMYPLPKHVMQPMVDKLEKLVVVELNFSGQFHGFLKSEMQLPKDTYSYTRVGGKPFNVSEIYDVLKKQYV